VNPRLTALEQAACIDRVEPALVIADPDQVAALGVPGGRPDPIEADPDRPVAIVFTSGTTGTPKGAWFTDRQLHAVAVYDVGAAVGGDRLIPQYGSTQFAHIGFTTKLPWYLRMGTTTHVLARWRAADALACTAEHRIPTIGGVAPQMALLLKQDVESYDLSCVETIIMGGAASPPSLVREARERFGAAYSIRYSSTESGGCGTGTAFDADDEEALFTVGKPRGGVEIQIRDEEDGVGELWLRSPSALTEYWRDPEGTAETLVDGWVRTGDLGTIDARGNLRLAGRSREMFIRGGYNVYPAEVEAALSDHPLVAEVVVVPRPDPVMGELGVAVVVPADDSRPPTLEELRAHLESKLARFKLPEAIRVVDEVPLTPMLKVDRRALAAREAHQ
jgi:acyl-CoA synthetase (AMP-forming)/AMP-acid ligase II